MKYRYFLLISLVFCLLVGCRETAMVSQDKVKINPASVPLHGTSAGKQDKIDNEVTQAQETSDKITDQAGSVKTEAELPRTLNYPVAFATQAPFANWDQLHEEACEEAAMIIAVKYFKKEPLSAHLMEQGILNLVKWEEENGYKVDLTAAEAVKVMADYFSQKSELSSEVTAEKIKQELVKGNLLIVPAAGRQLGNPNFKGKGPIYHMLVIRGYDDKTGEFITNDPGTRKGEGYRYKYKTLMAAVHDWDHQLGQDGMTDEEMEQGGKVLIIVNK